MGMISDTTLQDDDKSRASQMDELIVSENSTLPPQERHRILLEVHGFHPNTSEPADGTISTLLDRIRRQAATVRNRKAYNKALFLNPSYADSRSFLVMFLRAENFNPTKAAQSLVLHFETKLTLFGMDLLARKITYADLSEDDRLALRTGAVQVLPEKDRAGRRILYETSRSLRYKSIQNQLRAQWYMMMSLIENNLDAQKEGIVRLFYNLDTPAKMTEHNEVIQKGSTLARSLPIRFVGIHFCYNSEYMIPMLSAVQLAVGVEGRSRLRDHYGTEQEVKQKLEAYNIPSGINLPATSATQDDAVSIDYLEQYLSLTRRQEQEATIKRADTIVQPLSSDVILGRGRHQQEHPGNLELAKLVDSKREEYSKLRKLEKTRIIREIVESFESSGGRFVERNEEDGSNSSKVQWRESSTDARREKVSQLFRTKTTRNSEFFEKTEKEKNQIYRTQSF